MAKAKNQRLKSSNHDTLVQLAEEYEYIGREVVRDFAHGSITILAMPSKYKRKTEKAKRLDTLRKARQSYDYDEDEREERGDSRNRED